MSYAAYKAFQSRSSQRANEKSKEQRDIFASAAHRFAVGPLLRDELDDLLGDAPVEMLIPGLPEIETKAPPKRWTVLLFGRLDPDTDAVKQGRLGVAAFARAYRDALTNATLPSILRDRPRLKLYGIAPPDEQDLRELACDEAGAALDLLALPFEHDRKHLFESLGHASVAIMPSWHEGFGRTGWEAIGAGIPLIMSRQSGVYRFLHEEMAGAGTIYALDVRGAGIRRTAVLSRSGRDTISLSNSDCCPVKARERLNDRL
jgi:glycosyltransferase involved in cell wall biosynthesis